jgi:hypothetical protein
MGFASITVEAMVAKQQAMPQCGTYSKRPALLGGSGVCVTFDASGSRAPARKCPSVLELSVMQPHEWG